MITGTDMPAGESTLRIYIKGHVLPQKCQAAKEVIAGGLRICSYSPTRTW
jgi:hypothetical protein